MTLPAKLAQLRQGRRHAHLRRAPAARPRLRVRFVPFDGDAVRHAGRAGASINRAMEQADRALPGPVFLELQPLQTPPAWPHLKRQVDRMRLLLALMWLLHWLPLPHAGPLRRRRRQPAVYAAFRSAARIALTNLRLCMPELSEAERTAIARRHFQAYSRSILGALACCGGRRSAPAPPDPGRAVRAAGRDGKPARPSCCARTSCASTWPAWRSMRDSGVRPSMSPQKNKAFDAVLRRGRSRFGRCSCSRARTASSRSCARCATACPTSCCRTWTSARRMRLRALLRHPGRHPDRPRPHRGRHRRQGDSGGRDLPAELSRAGA
jgi:hypothetical protein